MAIGFFVNGLFKINIEDDVKRNIVFSNLLFFF